MEIHSVPLFLPESLGDSLGDGLGDGLGKGLGDSGLGLVTHSHLKIISTSQSIVPKNGTLYGGRLFTSIII